MPMRSREGIYQEGEAWRRRTPGKHTTNAIFSPAPDPITVQSTARRTGFYSRVVPTVLSSLRATIMRLRLRKFEKHWHYVTSPIWITVSCSLQKDKIQQSWLGGIQMLCSNLSFFTTCPSRTSNESRRLYSPSSSGRLIHLSTIDHRRKMRFTYWGMAICSAAAAATPRTVNKKEPFIF
ncbi:hypothetical protein BJV74DRAFT_138668 [Russula compacta]|nr:hypothetical protein BJV74DRAFT_138668 [Russula compacta]